MRLSSCDGYLSTNDCSTLQVNRQLIYILDKTDRKTDEQTEMQVYGRTGVCRVDGRTGKTNGRTDRKV